MNIDELVDWCLNLQGEAYDFFERDSAPTDPQEYEEMVEWIVDQLRKSTALDLLDEEVALRVDDQNAHMCAEAVERVI